MLQLEYYDPATDYTVASLEWKALLTIASMPEPAQALVSGGWQSTHFASAGTPLAFAQIAAARSPLALTIPGDVNTGATGVSRGAEAELPALRERLARLAILRQAATLQYRFAQQFNEIRRGVSKGEIDDPAMLLAEISTEFDKLRRAGTLASGRGAAGGTAAVTAGGPGSGKTTLANQIAEQVARSGKGVLYVTLEDSAEDLADKTVARLGNLDYSAVRRGIAGERLRIDRPGLRSAIL